MRESAIADYEHDIFISYRRSDPSWIRWTRETFAEPLATLLRPRLRTVSIFMDEKLETGAAWPASLARNLARSKIVVPVLSRSYFYSPWCRLELALMREREKLTKCRTRENDTALILPVITDDGEFFPAEVQAMKSERLHEFANPFMTRDSPRQEALAEVLRVRLCPAIEHVLERVPPFDPEWEGIAHDRFEKAFEIHVAAQRTLPSISL